MDCTYGGGNCGSTPSVPVVTVDPRPHTSTSGSLPFTGGDVVVLGGLGIVLLLAGVAARLTAGRLR